MVGIIQSFKCPNRIKSQKKDQFPFFLSRDAYLCLCLYIGGHGSRAFSLWWFYQSGPSTSVKWSESHSVMSNSLRPNGLYSPWNSPGQTTGVGSLSILQGIFPTQGSNPGLPHCMWILYQLSHKGRPFKPLQSLGMPLLAFYLVQGPETSIMILKYIFKLPDSLPIRT